MKFLSRQEELLLITIYKLKDLAYGVPIRDNIIEYTGKHWSIGAVYDILDRLTSKGFVEKRAGEPTPERRGRRKSYYAINDEGLAALEEVKNLHDFMWEDVKNLVVK